MRYLLGRGTRPLRLGEAGALHRGTPRSSCVLSGHEIGGAAGRQHVIGAVRGIDPSIADDAVQRAAQMIPTTMSHTQISYDPVSGAPSRCGALSTQPRQA